MEVFAFSKCFLFLPDFRNQQDLTLPGDKAATDNSRPDNEYLELGATKKIARASKPVQSKSTEKQSSMHEQVRGEGVGQENQGQV